MAAGSFDSAAPVNLTRLYVFVTFSESDSWHGHVLWHDGKSLSERIPADSVCLPGDALRWPVRGLLHQPALLPLQLPVQSCTRAGEKPTPVFVNAISRKALRSFRFTQRGFNSVRVRHSILRQPFISSIKMTTHTPWGSLLKVRKRFLISVIHWTVSLPDASWIHSGTYTRQYHGHRVAAGHKKPPWCRL